MADLLPKNSSPKLRFRLAVCFFTVFLSLVFCFFNAKASLGSETGDGFSEDCQVLLAEDWLEVFNKNTSRIVFSKRMRSFGLNGKLTSLGVIIKAPDYIENLDRTTGELIWRKDFAKFSKLAWGPVNTDSLYIWAEQNLNPEKGKSFEFFAFSKDGKQIWSQVFKGRYLENVIFNGNILIRYQKDAFQTPADSLALIDGKSGKILKESQMLGNAFSKVFLNEGAFYYSELTPTGYFFTARNAHLDLLWQTPCGQFAHNPVFTKDLVYLANDNSPKDGFELVALDKAKGTKVPFSHRLPGDIAAMAEYKGDIYILLRTVDTKEQTLELGARLYKINKSSCGLLMEKTGQTADDNPLSDEDAFVENGWLFFALSINEDSQSDSQSKVQICAYNLDNSELINVSEFAGLENTSIPQYAALMPTNRGVFLFVPKTNWLTGGPETKLFMLDVSQRRALPLQGSNLKGSVTSADAAPSAFLIATDALQYYWLDSSLQIKSHLNLQPFFNWTKWNNFAGIVLLSVCITYFIFKAKKQDLFVRRIAGLNALDDAVGRSTEMGKPVLYIPGISDVDDIQTLASLSILGHVSALTADYDIPILVPNCRSVVMSMAQEMVSEAYARAGRPDSFQPDSVCYLSDEQFGFAAGVCGIMVRERPAAVVCMGTFLGEALMLAETGNHIGAIQIAGSATISQLPFFVAACDYTLIGEELYAASAYLSKDPMQVGSLRGQDAAKALIMLLIGLGALMYSFGFTWVKEICMTL